MLLEQCQQGAVRIGEIIEQSENECSEIIGSLEAYCEWLYEKYQAFVSNEEPTEDFLKEGDAFCHRLSRQIAKNISVRREVVFLPYKASYVGQSGECLDGGQGGSLLRCLCGISSLL